MRSFLKISYLGTAYHGWQRQTDKISIQETIEDALTTLLRHKTEITGCGRTDKGVHAEEYFLHFDHETGLEDSFDFNLNSILPKDIAVHEVISVDDEAHARYDATSRSYRYQIHFNKDPFLHNRSLYWFYPDMHYDSIYQATDDLLKFQDYHPLSKFNPDLKTSLCEVSHAAWELNKEDGMLIFEISANRFLHSMVRRIVGCMLLIGRGQLTYKEFVEVMESRGEFSKNLAVPACGLYLTGVKYPYL